MKLQENFFNWNILLNQSIKLTKDNLKEKLDNYQKIVNFIANNHQTQKWNIISELTEQIKQKEYKNALHKKHFLIIKDLYRLSTNGVNNKNPEKNLNQEEKQMITDFAEEMIKTISKYFITNSIPIYLIHLSNIYLVFNQNDLALEKCEQITQMKLDNQKNMISNVSFMLNITNKYLENLKEQIAQNYYNQDENYYQNKIKQVMKILNISNNKIQYNKYRNHKDVKEYISNIIKYKRSILDNKEELECFLQSRILKAQKEIEEFTDNDLGLMEERILNKEISEFKILNKLTIDKIVKHTHQEADLEQFNIIE